MRRILDRINKVDCGMPEFAFCIYPVHPLHPVQRIWNLPNFEIRGILDRIGGMERMNAICWMQEVLARKSDFVICPGAESARIC